MITPLFKLVKVKLKAILFLGLLFGAMVIQAQERLTLNGFLSSTIDSNLVDQDSTTISLLSNKNYNIPLIKSTQFRLETRRFIETFQEYSVRIKPNNFREISSQKNIYANKIQEVRLENQIKINESLKNRYLLALDYIFNKKTAILYAVKQQQLKDKLGLLGHQVFDEDFEVKELIESEEDLLATHLKIIQLKKTREDLEDYLKKVLALNTVNIETSNLISPEQIINFPISDSISNEYLFVTLQKLKINTLENEMSLSVAKSNQLLDFVQAKYIGKSENLFEDNLSIGFGINLPFFGAARQDKSEFYFEKTIKQNSLNDALKKHQLKVSFAKNEFETSKVNYMVLQKQYENSSVTSIYEAYQKMEGVSPLLLLNLKILQNKKNIEILKFEQELYKAYIEFLSLNEQLFEQPLVNYLAPDFELLKN
jgi:hypothetical protein